MAKAREVFGYKIDISGVSVTVGEVQLTPGATADSEIDHYIEQLKADLDAVASKMKKEWRALVRANKPDF